MSNKDKKPNKETKKVKKPVIKAATDPITPVPDRDGNCPTGYYNDNGVCKLDVG